MASISLSPRRASASAGIGGAPAEQVEGEGDGRLGEPVQTPRKNGVGLTRSGARHPWPPVSGTVT